MELLGDLPVGLKTSAMAALARAAGRRLRGALCAVMAAVVALCGLTACGDDDGDEPTSADDGREEVTPPAEKRKRTVLVYMVADNSIGKSSCPVCGRSYDLCDIAEMQEAVDAGALGDDCRLLVYHNRPYTNRGNAPRMLEITPDQDPRVLLTYPDDTSIYSTSAERMLEVGADVRRLAPADSYGLVLWSHGTGWIADSGSRSGQWSGTPGVADTPVGSFGDDRGVKMTLPTLARGLASGLWEYIYFDCCHMATVEVAYELRHLAGAMAASATELPMPGMPYNINVKALAEGDVKSAAEGTFNYYFGLSGAQRTCSMTVVDLTAMDALAQATRTLMERGYRPGLAESAYQRYTRSLMPFNGTLYDFAQYIETLTPEPEPELLGQWRQALANAVMWQEATPYVFNQLAIATHCGLGCNIPFSAEDVERYGYMDTAWWADVVAAHPDFAGL